MLGIIIGVAAVVIMVSVVQRQNAKRWNTMKRWAPTKSTSPPISGTDGTIQEADDYCKACPTWWWALRPISRLCNEMTIKYGAKTLSTQNMG